MRYIFAHEGEISVELHIVEQKSSDIHNFVQGQTKVWAHGAQAQSQE